MARNAIEFANELTRWGERNLSARAATKAATQAVAKFIIKRIVPRTPVRTGLARGNWRLAVGARIASGVLSVKDPTGRIAIARMLASAAQIASYSKFSIYNNLPYIERLENGWSQQAPNGMIAVTIADLKANQKTISRDVLELYKAEVKYTKVA